MTTDTRTTMTAEAATALTTRILSGESTLIRPLKLQLADGTQDFFATITDGSTMYIFNPTYTVGFVPDAIVKYLDSLVGREIVPEDWDAVVTAIPRRSVGGATLAKA